MGEMKGEIDEVKFFGAQTAATLLSRRTRGEETYFFF